MSSIIQKEYDRARVSTGHAVYITQSKLVPMTMAAGATVSDTVYLPKGAIFSEVRAETATAFTGTPTNINLRLGTAAAGQEVVADVDVKAQGHVTATTVAAFDSVGAAASANTAIYLQLAANGGTNPAGTCNVLVVYRMPKPGN